MTEAEAVAYLKHPIFYGDANTHEAITTILAALEREKSKAALYCDALLRISLIEDQMSGSDWQEIEEARGLANDAMNAALSQHE